MTALQDTPENRIIAAQIAEADSNPEKYTVMRDAAVLGVVDTEDEAFAIWTKAWQDGYSRLDEICVIPPAAIRAEMRQRLNGRVGRSSVVGESDDLPKWVGHAVNSILDNTGVRLTRQQTFDLVSKRPALRGEIEEWGTNDTVVNEHLSAALLQEVFDDPHRKWPTYGDKVDFKSFHNELAKAALAKGYVVESYEDEEEDA